MEAAEGLAELTEISNQVREAVVLDRDGAVLASSFADSERSRRFAEAARATFETAGRARSGLTALEAATERGSLFLAADDERVVAAATEPDEPAGLVLYDLRSCLRRLAAE
jgi:predicted regulator of Ras-like GTPase activity (Roadblock/LC7/MglB family)